MRAAGTNETAGLSDGGAHRLPVRVYYEDTDFSGVVYHASYVRFLERGRTDMLRLMGVSHTTLHEAGLAFAVRKMSLAFDAPARIDDLLTVETRLTRLRGASIALEQAVLAPGGAPLVRADVLVALIGPDGRPKRLPAEMADRLGR